MQVASGVERPANDDFANRIALSGAAIATDGASIHATREAGEPVHAGTTGGRSVWWSWTAPENGLVTIKTDGSGFDTMLAVYTGFDLSGLSQVAADDDSGEGTRSLVSFDAVAGTAYAIAVDGYQGASGPIRLDVNQRGTTVAPPNDAFAARSLIPSDNLTVHGSNAGASKENGEPDHAGNSGGRSVWWTWTPTVTGLAEVSTTGSTFNTLLAVYTGTSVSSLVPVASNDQDPGGGDASHVSFPVTAGTTYQIAVDGINPGTGARYGSVSLNVSIGTIVSPVNDNLANAITIHGTNVTAAGSNSGASREAGEPLHAGAEGGRSVWWSWTALGPGMVTIHTAGSSFDTVLAVYTGNAVDTLTAVAGDDDSGGGRASRVTFTATAGTIYRIAVDGYHGSTGQVVLSLVVGGGAPPPINDNFVNRTAITSPWPEPIAGSNANATKEPGEANHADNTGGRSIWWRWTASSNAVVVLSTTDSSFDTLLAVYIGASVESLVLVAANDQDPAGGTTSRVTFNAIADQDYQIVVDGFNGAIGTVSLHLSVSALPVRPSNDLFADRQLLEGAVIDITGSNINALLETNEPPLIRLFGGSSVWWTWMAPEAGYVTVSTEGSEFSTVLFIHTGEALDGLSPVAADSSSGAGTTSLVSFNASAGTTYQIAVDGRRGAQGRIRLRISPGGMAPRIDQQPSDLTVLAEARASFVVDATGPSPLNYQWRKDAVPIPATTGRAYTIDAVRSADAGLYSVIVTNAFGSMTSAPATLTVSVPLTLVKALDAPGLEWMTLGNTNWVPEADVTHDGVDAVASGLITHNQQSRLQTQVTGPGTLTFWWKVSSERGFDFLRLSIDGIQHQAISGAVDWQQVTNQIPDGLHTLEWAYTKDPTATDGSDRGWLDQVSLVPLSGPPSITQAPTGGTVARGQSFTASVTVIGSTPLHYQWLRAGQAIGGATSPTLTIPSAQPVDAGEYSVTVSNALGTITSEAATWVVIDTGDLTFRIEALTTNNARVIDHLSLSGGDRGGIAASSSRLFYSGDSSTASFLLDDLSSWLALGRVEDALVSDLRRETIYALANGSTKLTGAGTVTTLLELDGVTALPTGNQINLSMPVTLASDSGVFAGFGRVVLHNGGRIYDVLVPGGQVLDLGPMAKPAHQSTENWAYWGVAELHEGALHLVCVQDRTTISRTRVPDGVTSPLATLSNLADMACLTVSASRGRWFFHHEGTSQFGGSAETVGYADAMLSVPEAPPRITERPLGRTVLLGDSVRFTVQADGSPPLDYQWRKDGVPIPSATATSYTIDSVQLTDAGGYSVVVANAFGSVVSAPATLVVNVPLTLVEALDAPGLVWTSSGGSNWQPVTDVTHDGVDAASSGPITHSQQSTLQTQLTGPGTLTFWWKVSSERGFDFLRFAVDGILRQGISGAVDWQQVTNQIADGMHTLEWIYAKDTSVSDGSDRGWLDQVAFTSTRAHLVALSLQGGTVQFTVMGQPGGTLRIDSSTDLSTWTEWRRITGFTGITTFIDSASTSTAARFYRAVRLP